MGGINRGGWNRAKTRTAKATIPQPIAKSRTSLVGPFNHSWQNIVRSYKGIYLRSRTVSKVTSSL